VSVVSNDASKAAGSVTGVVGSTALLPYTGNNKVALIVAIVALVASTAVLTAVVMKRIVVRP
jgi:hypothetical protein